MATNELEDLKRSKEAIDDLAGDISALLNGTATDDNTVEVKATDEDLKGVVAEAANVFDSEEAGEGSTDDGDADGAEPEAEQPDTEPADEDTDTVGVDEVTVESTGTPDTDNYLNTKSRVRLFNEGERIRNAIASAKAVESMSADKVRSNFFSTVSQDDVVNAIKERKPLDLLTEYTVDQLTGSRGLDGSILSPGEIDEATGLPYTKARAEERIKEIQAHNEKAQAEYDEFLKSEMNNFIRATEYELNTVARRAADEHIQIEALLDKYPILDVSNENLPEHFAELGNVFWKEVLEKYTENAFGEEVFKPNFDVMRAAEDFLLANENYLTKFINQPAEPIKKQTSEKKAEEPKEEVVKGIAVPAGKAVTASDDEGKDDGDFMNALVAKSFDNINKNRLNRKS